MKIPEEIFSDNAISYDINYDTARLSHIKAGGVADYIAFPETEDQLVNIIREFTENSISYKIIGNCSNVFFSDDGFRGVIISVKQLKKVCFMDNFLLSSPGMSIQRLMLECKRKNFAIPAQLCGIPGSIGGMVRGNAGAFGKSISDIFLWAKVYCPKKDKILIYSKNDMNFSYRSSVLDNEQLCLLEVALSITKEFSQVFSDKINHFSQIRSKSQPNEASLGSFFKRSDDVIPALLIDELGLKGYSVGGASISEKHAGFIINRGGACSKDINLLASYVEKRVKEAYGITLIREAEYVT